MLCGLVNEFLAMSQDECLRRALCTRRSAIDQLRENHLYHNSFLSHDLRNRCGMKHHHIPSSRFQSPEKRRSVSGLPRLARGCIGCIPPGSLSDELQAQQELVAIVVMVAIPHSHSHSDSDSCPGLGLGLDLDLGSGSGSARMSGLAQQQRRPDKVTATEKKSAEMAEHTAAARSF